MEEGEEEGLREKLERVSIDLRKMIFTHSIYKRLKLIQ